MKQHLHTHMHPFVHCITLPCLGMGCIAYAMQGEKKQAWCLLTIVSKLTWPHHLQFSLRKKRLLFQSNLVQERQQLEAGPPRMRGRVTSYHVLVFPSSTTTYSSVCLACPKEETRYRGQTLLLPNQTIIRFFLPFFGHVNQKLVYIYCAYALCFVLCMHTH